jgi:hypothetical protein
MEPGKSDWHQLCEAASKEHDPDKLKAIITELIKVLDERKRPSAAPQAQPQEIDAITQH